LVNAFLGFNHRCPIIVKEGCVFVHVREYFGAEFSVSLLLERVRLSAELQKQSVHELGNAIAILGVLSDDQHHCP
jgi:hypothetical protein